MPAGQPPLDIAVRCRNWLWYWIVKELSGLSDGKLDKQFAGAAGVGDRPRTFYRYRTFGSSPADIRGYRKNGLSVYCAVHGEGHAGYLLYEHARLAFESALWELIAKPGISVARCREIVGVLVSRRGLTRIAQEEAEVLEGLIDDPNLLVRLGLARNAEQMIEPLLDQIDLDLIALLGALYKIALATGELQRALVLQSALERAATLFAEMWRVPLFLQALFGHMLGDRLFRNAWLTEQDWVQETGALLDRASNRRSVSDAQRRREVRAFVTWYISPKRKAGRRDPYDSGLPMAATPALLWSRRYADALKVWQLTVQDHIDKAEVIEIEDEGLENPDERYRPMLRRARSLKEAIANLLMQHVRVFERMQEPASQTAFAATMRALGPQDPSLAHDT